MKKILFVCEGETEVFLTYKILKKNNKIEVNKKIEENGNLKISNITGKNICFFNKNIEIYIYNLKGQKNLKNFIEKFTYIRELEIIDKILFIIDAEKSYLNTKESLEYYKSKLIKENEKIEIEYFITPNNSDSGMTENLIIDALKCENIVKYIKNVVDEVKNMEEAEIKNETKSTFMMIAATQNPLKGNAPSFLSGCYDKINKENKNFKKIKYYIEKEIERRFNENIFSN